LSLSEKHRDTHKQNQYSGNDSKLTYNETNRHGF